MPRSFILCTLIIMAVSGCEKTYEAKDNLGNQEYNAVLMKIAPYVIKKSDDFSYEDRFSAANQGYYKKFIDKADGKLVYFTETDTASFFYFSYRDLSSLYEHYRGVGGYYKTDENDDIAFLNILYHTPRFTKPQMENRSAILFEEMVTKGNVNAYVGNRSFIHTPNKDFFYNTKTNRWDYTDSSSWKFLEEAKQKAGETDTIN
jgi:hypothetical protein